MACQLDSVLTNGSAVFWLLLVLMYGVLGWTNFKWYLRIKRVDEAEGSSLYIRESDIAVSDGSTNEFDVKVSRMFKSIALSDLFGMFLGLVAAGWSLCTL